jgi:hypothetical protein
VTRDRTDAPAPGTYGICYVNAFQTQPGETAWWTAHHPDLLLRDRAGHLVGDPDWPGEYLLDVRTPAERAALLRIVGDWFDGCARSGYRAIEPDNLDSWTRSHAQLTRDQGLAFAALLVQRAHARGLAVAQKNAAELGSLGRTRVGFDFAVAEECQVYDECGVYLAAYGAHVIEIEYTDTPRAGYTAACSARGARVSVLLRDREVVPRGAAGYVFEHC